MVREFVECVLLGVLFAAALLVGVFPLAAWLVLALAFACVFVWIYNNSDPYLEEGNND